MIQVCGVGLLFPIPTSVCAGIISLWCKRRKEAARDDGESGGDAGAARAVK